MNRIQSTLSKTVVLAIGLLNVASCLNAVAKTATNNVVGDTLYTSNISCIPPQVLAGGTASGGIELRKLDGETGAILANSSDPGDAVLAARWSPTGRYAAVGSALSGSAELQIFRNDSTALTLVDSFETGGTSINSVDWSPDELYVAICASALVRVFQWDNITETLGTSVSLGIASIVQSLHWSPDGKFLALGTSAGNVRVLTFNGTSLSSTATFLHGASDDVFSVDWSPDGRFIAMGGIESGTVEVRVLEFDGVSTLTSVATFSHGPADGIDAVAWSPCGHYVAIGGVSGDGGNELRVLEFDIGAGTLTSVADFSNGTAGIRAVAWYPSGTQLVFGSRASGSLDGAEIRGLNFDPEAGTLTTFFAINHSADIHSVDVIGTPNTLCIDCPAQLKEDVTFVQDATVCGDLYVKGCLGGNPDYPLVALGTTDDLYVERDGTDGDFLDTGSHPGDVRSVAWTKDGRFLAVAGDAPSDIDEDNENIRVYELDPTDLTLTKVAAINWPADPAGVDRVNSVYWHPDGTFLVAGGQTNPDPPRYKLRVYSFDGSSLTTIEESTGGTSAASELSSVAWSPDGGYIATGKNAGGTGSILVHSFVAGIPFVAGTSIAFPGVPVHSVSWNKDSNLLAVGLERDTDNVLVYSFGGGPLTLVDSATHESSSVNSVDWSPNANILVSGANEDSVGAEVNAWEFDGATLTQIGEYEQGEDVNGVAWYPDGNCIVIGSNGVSGNVVALNFDATDSQAITSVKWTKTDSGDVNAVDVGPVLGPLCVCSNMIVKQDVCIQGDLVVKGNFDAPPGPTGPEGPQGEVGPTGPQGPEGTCTCPSKATACDCQLEKCNVTSFRGNLGIDECCKLLVNFIDPVRSGDTKLEQDDGTEAITCFSGNVGLNECRSLLVNRICPVQDTTLDTACDICDVNDRACEENELGCLELCGDQVIIAGKLLVNEFGPFDEGCLTKDGIRGEPQPMRFSSDIEVDGMCLAAELRAQREEITILRALLAELTK